MATHSSTLAWKSHGRRSLVGCSPWGLKESDMTEWLHFHFSLSCIGEGDGNPLQCSCWRIPGMGEPCGLPSLGSHRVRHDWSNLAAASLLDIVLYWRYSLGQPLSITSQYKGTTFLNVPQFPSFETSLKGQPNSGTAHGFHRGLCNHTTAQRLLLPKPIPSLLHRWYAQGQPPINLLYTILHLRVWLQGTQLRQMFSTSHPIKKHKEIHTHQTWVIGIPYTVSKDY